MRKKGTWKRSLSVLLALVVAAGIQMPVTAQAAAADREGSVAAAVSGESKSIVAGWTLGDSGKLGENGGITWSYNAGTKTLTVSGTDVLSGVYEQGKSYSAFRGICEDKEVDRIVFRDCKLSGSVECLFSGLDKVKEIDLSGMDTEQVTDMWRMFSDCSGLETLDVKGLKTENVTNMSRMFDGCSGLRSLDIRGLNTANVTDMSRMFEYCSGLGSLDVSGFDTGNVSYMGYMFFGCMSLKSLDVSKFNTKNVSDLNSMFYGCRGLESLDVSGFHTGNAQYLNSMFEGCSGLSSLDLSSFVIGVDTQINSMLENCIPGVLKAPGEIPSGKEIELSVPYYNEAGQQRSSLTAADEGHTLTKEKRQETVVTYRIIYELNGGRNHKGNPVTGTSADRILLQAPSRTGYTFSGWYRNIKGKDTKVTEIPKGNKEDVTLSARWKANTYTIKFKGNGATGGKMTEQTKRRYGKSYTLAANKFKRTGYTFAGWNTKKNGSGKTYKNKASVKNLTKKNGGTVTLYAQWKKVKK